LQPRTRLGAKATGEKYDGRDARFGNRVFEPKSIWSGKRDRLFEQQVPPELRCTDGNRGLDIRRNREGERIRMSNQAFEIGVGVSAKLRGNLRRASLVSIPYSREIGTRMAYHTRTVNRSSPMTRTDQANTQPHHLPVGRFG
jgi:hypothetical protein